MFSQTYSELKIETIKPEIALDAITSNNGLVKTICSPVGDNQSWDLILPKLANSDTEATATTLLPTDAKIKLFKPANPKHRIMVGLLFDARQCNVKFAFEKNAFSKQWLNPEHPPIDSISLQELRDHLATARKNNIILENNEVTAELPNDSLVGVFATENNLFSRLNALAKHYLIKNTLHKDLPLLIITPESGFSLYNREQIILDVRMALSKKSHDPARIVVENTIDPEIRDLVASSHEPEFVENEIKIENQETATVNANYFFDDPNIPLDLKNLVLDKLEISDLALLVDEYNALGMKNVVGETAKIYLKKRLPKDLADLLTLLKVPTLNDDVVLKQIDSNLVERAIIHLKHSQPNVANSLVVTYAKNIKLDSDMVMILLKHFPHIHKVTSKIETVFHEGDWYAWDPSDPDVRLTTNWSPLMTGVLLADPMITAEIIRRFPHQVSTIISTLMELNEHRKKYGNDCHFSQESLIAATKVLVDALADVFTNKITLTSKNKRFIESYLISEINRLKTPEDIAAFTRQHANAIYLDQHRWSISDKVKGKTLTTIQERIAIKLHERSVHLGNTIAQNNLSNLQESKDVLEYKNHLHEILVSKRDQLKKQKPLFFSASATQAKQLRINRALEELKNIHDLPSLKVFTQNLMLDSDLIGRRTIGLLASDTNNQITRFYKKNF